MDVNKLKINLNKSQSIIINYKLRSLTSDIKLNYGFGHISTSEEMKYLGVLIDQNIDQEYKTLKIDNA